GSCLAAGLRSRKAFMIMVPPTHWYGGERGEAWKYSDGARCVRVCARTIECPQVGPPWRCRRPPVGAYCRLCLGRRRSRTEGVSAKGASVRLARVCGFSAEKA